MKYVYLVFDKVFKLGYGMRRPVCVYTAKCTEEIYNKIKDEFNNKFHSSGCYYNGDMQEMIQIIVKNTLDGKVKKMFPNYLDDIEFYGDKMLARVINGQLFYIMNGRIIRIDGSAIDKPGVFDLLSVKPEIIQVEFLDLGKPSSYDPIFHNAIINGVPCVAKSDHVVVNNEIIYLCKIGEKLFDYKTLVEYTPYAYVINDGEYKVYNRNLVLINSNGERINEKYEKLYNYVSPPWNNKKPYKLPEGVCVNMNDITKKIIDAISE